MNVIYLPRLPKTSAQGGRLKKLANRPGTVTVAIKLIPDRDWFRLQRTWRILFGLYQDCTSVPSSKGFKKRPGKFFTGKMKAARLPLFLREATQFVAEGRANIWVNDEQLRRRLVEVVNA